MRAETRHQLKTDRFSKATIHVAEQTVHWTVEHKNKLIVAAIVLVIMISALLGGWYYLLQQDNKASLDFGKAVQTLDTPIRPAGMPSQPDFVSFASPAERDGEARKQFQAVLNNYPHTRTADFARYFLGVTESRVGDNVAAERDLKSAASRGWNPLPLSWSSKGDLVSLAKLALASVYRNTGRPQDAIAIYKELIAKPTRAVGKSTAEIELAETYQSAGMTAEARKQYEQIQKEAPTSQAAQFASAKLQEVK